MNIKQFIEFLQTLTQDATVQGGAPNRQRWTNVSSIGSDG